ncbi:carbon-nitrogen hydrolase family protein [Leucobacter sp. HY1910]
MTRTLRVAAVQAEPVWFDLAATMDKTIDLVARAAAEGVDLIAFPETWLPGYPLFLWTLPVPEQIAWVGRYHANSVRVDGPEMRRLRETAREHGIGIVLGYSEKAHGSLYMAQTAIGPSGEILLHRRKVKPTHVERTLFGEGDGSDLVVADTPYGRLGALNCWEHLQPLGKYAMYAQNEQIHVAGWPCFGMMGQIPQLSPEANIGASRTYALEGGCFVLASTQIMSAEGIETFRLASGELPPVYNGGGGFATIFGPDSSRLSEPLDEHTEGFVTADIDLSWIDLAKNAADPAGHYSRPDVTQLILNTERRRTVIAEGLYGSEIEIPPLDSVDAAATRDSVGATTGDASVDAREPGAAAAQ